MADFRLHRPIRSSPLSGRPGGLPAVVEGGAGDLLTTASGDRLTLGHHALIRQLVNRTPPITSAAQIRSVALRVTQFFQPSRKHSIRPRALFRDTTALL